MTREREYVGDFLSDAGSALGSVFGSSSSLGSTPSLGSSDSGGGLGGIGSSLSNLFSGTGDAGSAIGNVFGQLAKTALPAVTQAAEGAVSKALSKTSSPSQQQQQQQSQPQQPKGLPQAPPTHVMHALNPQAQLNTLLTRLAKKYHMPPPAKPAGFVSKMMSPSANKTSSTNFGPGF